MSLLKVLKIEIWQGACTIEWSLCTIEMNLCKIESNLYAIGIDSCWIKWIYRLNIPYYIYFNYTIDSDIGYPV